MANFTKAIEEFRERIQTNLFCLLDSTQIRMKLLVELSQRQLLTEDEFENINVSQTLMFNNLDSKVNNFPNLLLRECPTTKIRQLSSILRWPTSTTQTILRVSSEHSKVPVTPKPLHCFMEQTISREFQ